MFRKFILCEILLHFTSHPSYFVLFCSTRDASAEPRLPGPGGHRRGVRKTGNLHKPVGTKSLGEEGSGGTRTLRGRPLRKQAVRVPARRTNTAKIQVVKNTIVRLGKGEQIPQGLENAQVFAQQERQSQQDPRNKYRSKRQSPRPQPEDNAGFGHSGILVFYI